MDIKGSGVALVTPFDTNGNINLEKVGELINFHIANNTDFIVICGTTGESATLTHDEKISLISFCAKKCKGKIPLIAGTGSNNTAETINFSNEIKELDVDGLLIVTPYYNKGNEDGLYMHYKEIADSVFPLPVILYNVPSRTGVDLSLNNIERLASISNIIGIKEANPSIEKIQNIVLKTRNLDFKVFSGNDNLVIPILSIGGSGVISVAANIIPDVMHNICSTKNTNLYYKYLNLMNSMFIETNPIMIKYAMNYLNYNVGDVRLPLYFPSNDNLDKMYKIIDEVL